MKKKPKVEYPLAKAQEDHNKMIMRINHYKNSIAAEQVNTFTTLSSRHRQYQSTGRNRMLRQPDNIETFDHQPILNDKLYVEMNHSSLS